MVSEMKVEVIQKEIIRPSSPTPHHLKSTKLSVFDQLVPNIYVQLLLFYPKNNSEDYEVNDIYHHSLVAERSKLLKKSLSEALTRFYPFAGEFEYNVSIRCNDHGAAFLEAQVNCPISNILDKPDLEKLWELLPSPTDHPGYLLLVQANFFECGGLTIGLNISHKVADASTFSKFINNWAGIARGSASTKDHLVIPAEFGAAASLFPPQDLLNSPPPPTPSSSVNIGIKEKVITRRFVFDASRIAALKSKAASPSMPNPTRIEVVSALIWKCAVEASRSNSGSVVRPSSWCQTVNMRKILVRPPLADKDLMGNVVALVAAKREETEINQHDNLQSLVSRLRKGLEELKVKYETGVSWEDVCQQFTDNVNLILSNDIDSYSCTSWCRIPLYESNFGWGKPFWVFIPSISSKNIAVFLDARDGNGIEASLTFKEEDMAIFETNKELLEYASLNPTVV